MDMKTRVTLNTLSRKTNRIKTKTLGIRVRTHARLSLPTGRQMASGEGKGRRRGKLCYSKRPRGYFVFFFLIFSFFYFALWDIFFFLQLWAQQNFNEARQNWQQGAGASQRGGGRSRRFLAAASLHSKNMAKNPELFQSCLTEQGTIWLALKREAGRAG